MLDDGSLDRNRWDWRQILNISVDCNVLFVFKVIQVALQTKFYTFCSSKFLSVKSSQFLVMYVTWLDNFIHCWQYWWCVASVRSLKIFMVLAEVRWNITVIKLREINWMWHIMRMCRLKYTRYLSEGLRKYREWWVGVHLGNFFRVCGIYSLEPHINASNATGCISWVWRVMSRFMLRLAVHIVATALCSVKIVLNQ